jgi:hypothetical protein
MPSFPKFLGLAALAGTIVPPALFMLKIIPLDAVKTVMLISTIVWFAAAPFWLKTDEN